MSKPGAPQIALKNRNFQLYFSGQFISLIGTWMEQMALSWLIYSLTNSAFMLGVFGFASQAPSFLLTPLAGIVVDRVNRHRMVIITQTCALLQASALAALALTGHAQIWQLMAIGVLMGTIRAFDIPSRQTFIVDMCQDKEQLPNAIATNSSIVTMTRLIGPSVAGILIAWVGEGMCFLLNAISYIFVIIPLFFVKANQTQRSQDESRASVITELKEGFAYSFGFQPIRSLILLLALISLLGMPYSVLMPAFAKTVFHGNAATLGFLTAASGVGSLVGALFLVSRKGVLGLGRWIALSCAIFGMGLVVFGLSHWFILSLVALAFAGFGSMVQTAATNTVLQTIVEEDKRGRVMSLFSLAFMGLAPFGSMGAGALSNQIGVNNTVMISGIFCVALGLAFAKHLPKLRQQVRPIYIDRGIIVAETEMQVLNG